LAFHHTDRVAISFDTASAMSFLHIDSVTKYVGNRLLLSDIFLRNKKGEIDVILGRNGSGKTTLLKIIFGIESSTAKFVKVNNKIVKSVGDSRGLVNYLPQENFLPNNINVEKLIKLFLPRRVAPEVIQNEHIQPLLKKKNRQLSGGERRIVEVMLILHSDASFILLDEPFNGVGPMVRDQIKDLIFQMKSKKGIVISDHDFENILPIADSIHFLRNGALKKNRTEKRVNRFRLHF